MNRAEMVVDIGEWKKCLKKLTHKPPFLSFI